MNPFDKISATIVLALLALFLTLFLGAMRKDTQNQECRLAAIAAKIPSAEIIQLCK